MYKGSYGRKAELSESARETLERKRAGIFGKIKVKETEKNVGKGADLQANSADSRVKRIDGFREFLTENEKSEATIQKYLHEAAELEKFLNGAQPNKSLLAEYRLILKAENQAQTVNGKICAIHAYLDYLGKSELKLRLLRVQRKCFTEERRELTQSEYKRLLSAAQDDRNERLYHIMLTLCGTGIRISELQFITVRAAQNGEVQISLKGKSRIVLISKELQKRLLKYAEKQRIDSGCIFRTRNGKPVDRSNVFHEMKKLCNKAKVSASKVFPHNFRHLFARTFYAIEKNLAHLSDLLGHSSIETTRIYVAVSTKSYERTLTRMNLIL